MRAIDDHYPKRTCVQMEELAIDEGSGGESEEGECSSDGEDTTGNLLGIPLESRIQLEPIEAEGTGEMESGSEGEEGIGEKGDRDGVEGEDGDRITPEKLMQLG